MIVAAQCADCESVFWHDLESDDEWVCSVCRNEAAPIIELLCFRCHCVDNLVWAEFPGVCEYCGGPVLEDPDTGDWPAFQRLTGKKLARG